MASHKSALKAHRQSLNHRIRNRTVKGSVRAAVKRTRTQIEDGELDAARDSIEVAMSRLDRAAKKGIIHPNNAARRKSRLMRQLNQAVAQGK